jgi:type IV pilus assembly protein PilP
MLYRVFVIYFISVSFAFADYNSDVELLNKYISDKYQSIKSSEKLEIPEYKGDILTFEKLSKIKNIFSLAHELPFSGGKTNLNANSYEVPDQLGIIMSKEQTELQKYSLNEFKLSGVVFQNDDEWAVFYLPNVNTPVYVAEGEIIGKNFGAVDKISKEQVDVIEWQKNPITNNWEQNKTLIK